MQQFVSQARRARDFWAGSFLLSWLSGVAIREVEAQGGNVKFPMPNEDFILALEGKSNSPPNQGNVPNRFKAALQANNKQEAFEKAKKVEAAIQEAWKALANDVFESDFGKHPQKQRIKDEIWDIQIQNFWEVAWVLTDDVSDSKCLDRRKYWRSYVAPPQAGVKCMMMDGWQELSGLPKGDDPHPSRGMLKAFWEPIQKRMATDLREDEMLCAIAFVKRRFVRHFEWFSYTMPSGWELKGWKLSPHVPAVDYMAAVHWLSAVLKKANESAEVERALDAYQSEVGLLSPRKDSYNISIKVLEDFKNSKFKDLVNANGSVFHPAALENPNIFPDIYTAKQTLHALQDLNKAAELTAAKPFYAVLLMDGDSIGKLLQSFEGDGGLGEEKLSRALSDFTQQVEAIVAEHNGFLIYAGGDDVLAFMPVEDAITCAVTLKCRYADAFKHVGLAGESTLSGAIQFSHIQRPLNIILRDSHLLLDKVAKEKTGRNALAISVQRSSGTTLTWSMPWDKVLIHPDENNDYPRKLETHIEKLAYDLKCLDQNEPQFSNKLLFKIEELFSKLSGGEAWDDDSVKKLLFMAYRNSGKSLKTTDHLKEDDLEGLLCQSHVWKTGKEEKVSHFPEKDAALLMRFLAQHQQEGM